MISAARFCYPFRSDERSTDLLVTERRILTEPSGRKVVVTGARGFVGTPVVEALLLGGWEANEAAPSVDLIFNAALAGSSLAQRGSSP